MNMTVFPQVPDVEPGDYRAQSRPVVIRSNRGQYMTARWTVYEEDDNEPAWELVGRDGLQLEPSEVARWFCPLAAEDMFDHAIEMAELAARCSP